MHTDSAEKDVPADQKELGLLTPGKRMLYMKLMEISTGIKFLHKSVINLELKYNNQREIKEVEANWLAVIKRS